MQQTFSTDEINHLFDIPILDNHLDKNIFRETRKSLNFNKAMHILLRIKGENMVKMTYSLY
jgi:hypothetical protein